MGPQLLTYLAGQGRSVFVSSHLLSEMALMADDLVVIGRGRLIAHSSVERLRGPLRPRLGQGPQPPPGGARPCAPARGRPTITYDGPDSADVSASPLRTSASWRHASASRCTSSRRSRRRFEEAFLEGTKAAQQFRAGSPPGGEPLETSQHRERRGHPREERHPLRVDQAPHRSLEPRAAPPLRRRPGCVHHPHHGHGPQRRHQDSGRLASCSPAPRSATS